MARTLSVTVTWIICTLVIVLLSEQVTFFDKTQWCLLTIMYWLIDISVDIYANKE